MNDTQVLKFTFEELRFIVRSIGKGHNKSDSVNMYDMRNVCDEMKAIIKRGSVNVGRKRRNRTNFKESQTGSQGE